LGLLQDIFTLTPAASQTYTHDGQLPAVGMTLRNPRYAAFLGSLATTGATGWRDVAPLTTLLDEMSRHQGLLTQQDVDAYAVMEREPLDAAYRGSRITSNPAPSFGGSIVAAALTDLDQDGVDPGRRQQVRALARATEAAKDIGPRSSRGTTHISVVDGDGGLVSMTTSNGSCSGVMIQETGVQLNNMMGEADLHPDGFHVTKPGIRIGSMMAPMVLDLPDGTVVALGSGGSERIRSALTQVVTQLVHDSNQVGLQDAVNAPRAHFDGDSIQAEPGLPESALQELAAEAPVNRWSRQDLYFGGVHGVSWHPDGTVTAAGDARRDGVGLVVQV
jgi:gamma-glutamyltranspeptidase/glutathione hydrolase